MTVSSTAARWEYDADGVTTTFPYTSKAFADSEIKVSVVSDDGAMTEQTLNNDYYVTGIASPQGGSVVFESAPTGKVVIRRVVSLEQKTDIKNQGAFYPEIHENEFDRRAMVDQQQQDELRRAFRLSPNFPIEGVDFELPSPRARGYFRWNDAATALENFTPEELYDETGIQEAVDSAEGFKATAQTAATTATAKASQTSALYAATQTAAASVGPYIPFADRPAANAALTAGSLVIGDQIEVYADAAANPAVSTRYDVIDDGAGSPEIDYANGRPVDYAFPVYVRGQIGLSMSRSDAIASVFLRPGQSRLIDGRLMYIVEAGTFSANGDTVIDVAGGALQAVLAPDQPLRSMAVFRADTRPAEWFPTGYEKIGFRSGEWKIISPLAIDGGTLKLVPDGTGGGKGAFVPVASDGVVLNFTISALDGTTVQVQACDNVNGQNGAAAEIYSEPGSYSLRVDTSNNAGLRFRIQNTVGSTAEISYVNYPYVESEAISIQAENIRIKSAAPDSTEITWLNLFGYHVSNAAGAPFYILPGADGRVSASAAGIDGSDPFSDDTDAFNRAILIACSYAPQTGGRRRGAAVQLPYGVTRIAQANTLLKTIEPTTGGSVALYLYGSGPNTGYAANEGATIVEFDPPTSGTDQALFDNDSRVTWSKFHNIGFISRNGGKFWNGPDGMGVQSFEWYVCGFRGFLDIFDAAGPTNNSEWSFFGCKFSHFDGTAFNFDNAQALNWRFYGCDAEVFSGTLFNYEQGTNVIWDSGSIIPQTSAGRIFRVPEDADPNSFGAGNRPHLVLRCRIELHDGALFAEKIQPAVNFRCIVRDSDMGSYQIPDGTKAITWRGAGRITFEQCAALYNYRWDYAYAGSSSNQQLKVLLNDCTDISGNFIKASDFVATDAAYNDAVAPLFVIRNCHPELDGTYRPGSEAMLDVEARQRFFSFSPVGRNIFRSSPPAGGWPAIQTLALPPVRLLGAVVYPVTNAGFGAVDMTVEIKAPGGTVLASFTWAANDPPPKIAVDFNYRLTSLDDTLTFEFSSTSDSANLPWVGSLALIY